MNGASKIDAFLWHQGETKRPGFESPTDYQTDFETLLSQLESETWWDDNVQVLVGEQIIGSFYQNAENYNDYWRSFNDSGNPFLKAVSAEGLAMNAAISDPDSVHFSGPALYELGRRYWKAYLGDKSVLANRADETTLFGGVSVTYDWKPYKFKAKVILDPLAGRIIENKRIAPTRAGGGFEAGQRVVDQVRCTVTHLTDGTFEVAADNVITLGDWHFTLDDYTQVGPSVTKSAVNDNILTIAGNVDKTLEEKFKIWLDDGDTATLNISYEPYLDADNGNSDDLMEIDWGDGTVDSDLARGTHSHNYSPNYAGYVTVSLPAFCEVTAVISSAGKWRSPVSAFSHLSQMFYFSISGAGSKLYGNLRDLPDAVITCIVQGDSICTWDFTGLPNLKNLTCQGQTDINNPAQFAEMNECTRIILDGKDRTSAQVDDVLIALAEVKTWDGTADIFINYSGQAAPTTASDAAVAELVARGVTVNTN